MVVLDTSNRQKVILTSLLTTLFIAGVLFGVMLIANSAQLSNGSGVVIGKIGSLELFEIQKTPLAGGGFSGGFKLLTRGFLAYTSTWATMGILLGVIKSRSRG
jgi:hypothetical protein